MQLEVPEIRTKKIRKSQCGWGFWENGDMADREKGKAKRPLFGFRPTSLGRFETPLGLGLILLPCTGTSPDSVKFYLGGRCDGGDLP